MDDLPSELSPEEVEQVRELLHKNNADNADNAEVIIVGWLPKFCRPLGRVGKFFLWLSLAWNAYEVYMVPHNVQEGFKFYQSTYDWANEQISEYVASAIKEPSTSEPEQTSDYIVWKRDEMSVDGYSQPESIAVIPATGLPPETLGGIQPISINLG